jgi:predicted RNA-binding Zn-ribbon protein involved in translation (DUF1610 family)
MRDIDMSAFLEQDFPFQCPACETDLNMNNAVGVGEYPKGGHRNMMRPNRTRAVGFECPKCFEKSCFHDTDGTFEKLYIECEEVNEMLRNSGKKEAER